MHITWTPCDEKYNTSKYNSIANLNALLQREHGQVQAKNMLTESTFSVNFFIKNTEQNRT